MTFCLLYLPFCIKNLIERMLCRKNYTHASLRETIDPNMLKTYLEAVFCGNVPVVKAIMKKGIF